MTDSTPESLSFRAMRTDDLAGVVALEQRCHVTPWSVRLFEEELACAHAAIDILWQAERLVGCICCRQVCDELHILKVTVDHDFRRCGFGSMLLKHVLERGRAAGCERVFLEVRSDNCGAIALYRSFDFEIIGCRKQYYPDGEDALVMERTLAND
jgi:ribosomal-protein-alanine N-acetyltransferase